MKIMAVTDLVDMRVLARNAPYRIDMVYANATHPENIFGIAIYKPDAGFYLYKGLAQIIIRAANLCQTYNLVLVLKDGLRPVEAQAAMQEAAIVKANPQWMADDENRLLSPPGMGGHPRGMAVDVALETRLGEHIDCGTCFDAMVPQSRRDYTDLPASCLHYRALLTDIMTSAAQYYNVPLLPLPSEWWDFRYPADIYNQYAPMSNTDLPDDMKMVIS